MRLQKEGGAPVGECVDVACPFGSCEGQCESKEKCDAFVTIDAKCVCKGGLSTSVGMSGDIARPFRYLCSAISGCPRVEVMVVVIIILS